MLRRVLIGARRPPPSSIPFDSIPRSPPQSSAAAPSTPSGRRRDITFHNRFLTPAPQPTVIESIWQIRTRRNVQKAQIRNLPRTEKARYYLETRSRRQKLLDWAGSKSRELARTMGTVDAWSGPVAKTSPYALLQRGDIKMLGSGGTGTAWRISERVKRIMTWGMLISMGAMLGWVMMERTQAEGPVEPVDRPKKQVKVPVAPQDEQKRLGVFVWGSNRYNMLEFYLII